MIALLAISTLLVTACGSSPADTATTGTTAAASGASSSDDLGFGSVYAAVNGLTGQAREQKLIELAKAEGGTVDVYHVGTMDTEIAGFTKETGIKVKDFQATNERVSEKVQQEAQAGRPGSDMFLGDTGGIALLNKAGAIAPLRTPNLDNIDPLFSAAAQGQEIPYFGIMSLPVYNSSLVKQGDLPTSWDDFFKNYKGTIAYELTDWSWFATLVTKWFEAKDNLTEDQAIALITNGFKGATQVDGHTLEAQLLASGQFGFAISFFNHYFKGLKDKGAPISFMPASSSATMPPVLVIGNSLALTAHAAHPAAGLLFLEYLTSANGQKLVSEQGYVPTLKDFPGQTVLDTYPSPLINDETTKPQAEQDKWQAAWTKMIQSAGGKKVTGS